MGAEIESPQDGHAMQLRDGMVGSVPYTHCHADHKTGPTPLFSSSACAPYMLLARDRDGISA